MDLEEQLFFKTVENDRDKAYLLLVDSYTSMVYNVCLNLLRNKEDAEDLTQEVFTSIYLSMDSFQGNSKLSTWIYSITLNKSKEFLRHKTRKKRFGLFTLLKNDEGESESNRTVEFNHPGIQLEDKERAEILFEAIDSLPENQRNAYILHKVEGVSYQEIAEILDLTVSSVESLMFRAKKGLQDKLKDYYYKNEF